MRGDLDRADLSGRARRLAEFAIKATLMQGRTRVVIPNRQRLCDLLKIGKNHVAEVLAALVSSRILSVKEIADGWEMLVYPDASGWDVEWMYGREDVAAFLAMLNQAPGQAQGEFIEPEPNLARTMAEYSAEKSASSQNGNRRTADVPKMGTFTPTPLRVKDSKDSKAFSFESFKGAVIAIDGRDEQQAMAGFRQVLGSDVMENDGGKWRNRWRTNRSKVKRVFAAAVEDMSNRQVRQIGAHTEWLWKKFDD